MAYLNKPGTNQAIQGMKGKTTEIIEHITEEKVKSAYSPENDFDRYIYYVKPDSTSTQILMCNSNNLPKHVYSVIAIDTSADKLTYIGGSTPSASQIVPYGDVYLYSYDSKYIKTSTYLGKNLLNLNRIHRLGNAFVSDKTDDVVEVNWNFILSTDWSYLTELVSTFFNHAEINSKNLFHLKNLPTGNVTTMYEMFYGCTGLTNVDGLASWDTGNVTTMQYMFHGCSPDIDYSNIFGGIKPPKLVGDGQSSIFPKNTPDENKPAWAKGSTFNCS